jgi:hypothetical protein
LLVPPLPIFQRGEEERLIEDLEVRAYKPGTREPADVMGEGMTKSPSNGVRRI